MASTAFGITATNLALVGIPLFFAAAHAKRSRLRGAAITLAVLSGCRLAVFSDVLPNTFWAKRWPPYAAFGFGDRLAGALELPIFFVVPVLVPVGS